VLHEEASRLFEQGIALREVDAGRPALVVAFEFGEQVSGIVTALRTDVVDHPLDLRGVDKWTLKTQNVRAGRQQHVAHSHELVSAPGIQDGTRVHLGNDTEGKPRREVSLDDPRNHVDRRPLGGDDQMDADCTRQLGKACYRCLYLLTGGHHKISKLIDY